MKRFFILLVTFSVALTVARAADSNSNVTAADPAVNYITRQYDYKGFTGLDISSAVELTLVKSDTYSVEVTCPDYLVNYLIVRVSGDDLKINVRSLSLGYGRRDWKITATVSMPVLYELELSGASSLTCSDTFDAGQRDVEVEVSGASNIEQLKMKGSKLELEVSGASDVKFQGEFSISEVEVSGASNVTANIDCRMAEVEVSGSSNVKYTGSSNMNKAKLSGASKLTLNGSAESLVVGVSGASRLDAGGYRATDVRANVSGASKATVNAGTAIGGYVDNASTLEYVGNPDTTEVSVSTGSVLRNVK